MSTRERSGHGCAGRKKLAQSIGAARDRDFERAATKEAEPLTIRRKGWPSVFGLRQRRGGQLVEAPDVEA